MRAAKAGMLLLRKAQSLLDRPYSSLQIRDAGIRLREAPTYRERLVLRDFRSFLDREDMIVYDIGAHTGVYTAAFAKVAHVATVISFEPIPDVFASLTERVRRFPQVRCFNVALGEEMGTVSFNRSSFSPSSSMLPMGQLHQTIFPHSARSEQIAVQMARLDDLVSEAQIPSPDLVKLDVQGFEDRVLRGGERTVRRARHCIVEMSLVPLYENSLLFDEAYDLMRSLNFQFAGYINQLVSPSGQRLAVDAIFQRKDAM